MSKKKIIGLICCLVIIANLFGLMFAGWRYGWGPFHGMTAFHSGNKKEYSIENVEAKENSPLAGKNILFLGSSVTKGACSVNESMADYIGALDGANVTKEAVSGTTLSTAKENSYVERLKKVDTKKSFDVIVVQLSTNDASQDIPLGELSDSFDKNDFDTETVTGAIEYIISYCRDTWDCPILFYTGTKYESENYEAMVNQLFKIQDKWEIEVLDLWNDEEMNGIKESDYKLYMFDSIHPTRAGYLLWWTPKFEDKLYEMMK